MPAISDLGLKSAGNQELTGRGFYEKMLALMFSSQHWLEKLGASVSGFIMSLGGLGVMALAVADSSFLSLPEGNDFLIVVLSTGKSWGNMAYYVGMTTLGSVLGCLLLYFVGRRGGSPVLRRKFSAKSIDRAENLFERYGVLTIVIPSILPPPLPFKIFVLCAGVFRLKTLEFLAGVLIGRTLRYSMWGVLAVLYGNSVKLYMQQNLDLIGIILFGVFVLAIAVSGAYYFYFRRARVGRTGKTG
jgi:membrane protein DedA with SNARE-associated domain